MSEATEKYRDTLTAIGRLAEQAVNGAENGSGPGLEYASEAQSCMVQSLPARLLTKAAEVAIGINPQNAPVLAAMIGAADLPLDPMHLTVLTSKYWGPQPRQLTVSFMGSTPQDLKARILQHMNAWNGCSCISFVLTTGTGDVRISRGAGGYWSYLGTDIRLIPANNPTMNLQGFTMNTSENEYKRVVRHETGHTLGFPHEHMRRALVARIDRQKAYAYFLQNYGWSQAMVDQQVLTALPQGSFMGTPADQDSIMCYQLPGSITMDGQPIRGGLDIDATDCRFASEIYPPVGSAPSGMAKRTATGASLDWDEREDVTNPDLT
jgi:hypothetical protein